MRLIEQLNKIETMLASSSMTELEYDSISLEIKKLKRFYETEKTEIGLEEVAFVVRSYYNLPKDFHIINSRKRNIVKARQMCAKILTDNTPLTYNQIGNYFNKDHSTIIHSKKTINDLIETDRKIRSEYGQIKQIINEKYGQLENVK